MSNQCEQWLDELLIDDCISQTILIWKIFYTTRSGYGKLHKSSITFQPSKWFSIKLLFVGILPDFGKSDGRVEPIEDGQGQGGPDDEGPGREAVSGQLDGGGLHFLHLESVHHPKGQIGYHQESNELSAGLCGRDATSADHIWNEEGLNCHLQDRQATGNEDRQVLHWRYILIPRNDPEHGIDVETKGCDFQ